jgi:hypothetical protein
VNGVAQPTTYQSGTILGFALSPTQLNAMGEIPVTVVNPAPGGGSSAPYPLIAYLSIPLSASSMVIDPVGGLLYVASPASATQNPSTIIPINPATGAMMTPIAVSSDPQVLAVSDDGSELYVATSAGVLQRINLKTLAVERTSSLPVDAEWGQTYAPEMHVVPGSPKSIVVELFDHVDPEEEGAALYNDTGLVNWIPGVNNKNPLMLDSFTFTSPTSIYGLPEGNTFFAELQVSSAGLSVISPAGFSCCNETTGSTLVSDGTLLYANSGEVWNPTTQTLLGTYLEPTGSQLFYAGRPVLDTVNGHTYFFDDNLYAGMESLDIDVFDQPNYGLVGTIPFFRTNFLGVSDLVRWGRNGLAFRSYDSSGTTTSVDQIVILTSSKVNSSSGAPIPTVSSVSPLSAYVGGPAFAVQVHGTGFTSASTVLIGGNPRSTTFVSATLLNAQVLAADIAAVGQLNVQVITPGPGGGASDDASISIGIQTPVVTVTPSSSNATTAQTLTVTVSVTGESGYPTPTGTVVLSSTIYSSAEVTLSGGSATFSLPAGSMLIGTDTLTISYSPDSTGSSIYKSTTGLTTVSVGVQNKTTPTVSIVLSSSSITTAQSLTLTAKVSGDNSNPTPTGSLTITLGGATLAEPYLTSGNSTIGIGAGELPVGNDTLAVTYAPDSTSSSTYNNSTGTAPVVVTVPPNIVPTVTVTPSASSITTSQALTVKVAVSGGSGNATPTGSVTLTGASYTSSASALIGGIALFNIPSGSLPIGADTLTATYSGNSNYRSSVGTASETVSASTAAMIATPKPGSTLGTSNVTFTWTPGYGVASYTLWLGLSGPGSSSLYNSGPMTAPSATVTSLPARGATVYARLFSVIGGKSQHNDYTYAEAGSPAAMTSPAPGKTLGTSGVTFTWTAGYGVTEYNLWLGTTAAGSSNLYSSGWVTATSATVAGVPPKGATVYARLYSMVEGVEQYIDYSYTETEAGTPATMISPKQGSTLGTSGVMFAWITGTGATKYNLWLGLSGPGSRRLYASGWSAATSVTVPSLPGKGATVYARLYSDVNGVTEYNDYTYTETTASPPATMISPAPGATLGVSGVIFNWTVGTSVTNYAVWLGTSGPGSSSLYSSGLTAATSVEFGNTCSALARSREPRSCLSPSVPWLRYGSTHSAN